MSRWSALCLFLSLAVPSLAQAGREHIDPGDVLPTFRLKALNPEALGGAAFVDLERYVGAQPAEPKKAVLLTFFATYCEPCKHEMPYLAALYSTYKDKGLQIVSVSIDKEADKVEFAHTLGRDKGVTFPMVSDRFNIVAKRYMINQLPSVFLADGSGKIIAVNVGYKEDAAVRMHAQIRQALGLPDGDPVAPALANALAPYLTPVKK